MNTIERYISHLNEFRDSELTFLVSAVNSVNALNLQDQNFISSITQILNTFTAAIPADIAYEQRVVVGQVDYILRKLIEYHTEVYSDYKKLRVDRYPAITDQLDMIWHAIDSGSLDKSSNFYATIKAIKDQYPKS